MRESLEILNQAQQLSETGQHAAVLEYLGGRRDEELEDSPTLALLYGIAQARLGSPAAGHRWVSVALEKSRERGDRVIEARALNVCGAIALERGQIDRAAEYFTHAIAEAEREGNRATVGRCANNLGIIANLRGDYGRAIGSYTMATAAFQQVGLQNGIAEALHNLAISYRDQGDLDAALHTADRALEAATDAENPRLIAQSLGGRAEIRLLLGDVQVARREVEHSLEKHREVGNVVGEAEDLRVLAGVHAAMDQPSEAERTLRDVVSRAEQRQRPLLAAQAERDLARLLYHLSRLDEAAELARTARVRFSELGAEAEARALDDLIGQSN